MTIVPGSASAVQPAKPVHPQTWDVWAGVTIARTATEGMVFLPGEIWINVGDTVVWHAGSDIAHTVTFLKPGQKKPAFNRNDPLQINRQGKSHYDGHSYYNSGLLSNSASNHHTATFYALTFDVVGIYRYYCLIHSGMHEIVHVRSVGTSYPFTHHDYQQQVLAGRVAIQQEGARLATAARKYATNRDIIVGVSDGLASNYTFTPRVVTLHVGQKVTFEYAGDKEPHTVTFGALHKSDKQPSGGSNFDGIHSINSGWLGSDWYGTSYQVTFSKAGSFAFRDDLHKNIMFGTVTVLKK